MEREHISAVESSVFQPRMDTSKTPKNELPSELLTAARAIMQVGSDIFTFGRFPKTDFESALREARRRWMLACNL